MGAFWQSLRQEDVVGLDIGDRGIALARFGLRGSRGLHLRNVGWADCGPDTPDAETASIIRRLWRESRLSTRTVCSCLHCRSLVLKPFSYSGLSAQEIESALRLEAEEAVQAPQQDLAMDFHLAPPALPASAKAPAGNAEGFMAAVRRKDIARHLALLRMARLCPVVLDVGCTAMCNLFLKLRPDRLAGKVVCLTHLYHQSADIAILQEPGRVYPRTFFCRSAVAEDGFDYLIQDLQNMLKYHQFKLQRPPVEHVMVTGQVPSGDALAKRIGDALGLPGEFWNPMRDQVTTSAFVARWAKHHQGMESLTTIGLGLALRGNENG